MSRASSADHHAQHEQEALDDAVLNQTHAAQTRREMTERYHLAVVRGRHPRSFPRDSALWVHTNQSKERSIRLKRGQSLASGVGGDPSVFQSVTFQGSQISYDDIDADPSFHPSRSAWSSQQEGSGSGSLDLGAPPGTAGLGMFPPVFGSAPGTQESQYLTSASGEIGERSASGVLRKDDDIQEERKIASFQFGRRLSIQRTNAVKAAAKASSQHQQGNRRRQHIQGSRRKTSGMQQQQQQQQQRRHRATTLGTAQSSMSTSSLSSVSPHDALAQVRARHGGGGSASSGTRQCVECVVVLTLLLLLLLLNVLRSCREYLSSDFLFFLCFFHLFFHQVNRGNELLLSDLCLWKKFCFWWRQEDASHGSGCKSFWCEQHDGSS